MPMLVVRKAPMRGKVHKRTYVCSNCQSKDAKADDEDIHQKSNPATNASLLPETRTQISSSHSNVGNSPKNPAKEGIEEGTHKREQIGEEGNDLGDNQSSHPCESEDTCPRCPTNDRMVRLVARAFEDAEEDKTGGDGCVQDTQENQGWDHERERNFLVNLVSKGAESWSGVVLSACIAVDDATDQREDDDLGDGDNPESLAEVIWVLHLGDKRRERDLTNERVADVEEGVHACNECGSSSRDNIDQWLASYHGFASEGVYIILRCVAIRPVLAFCSCESSRKNDTDKGEESRDSCELRQHVKGPRQRAEERYNGAHNRKDDSAGRVICHGVEIARDDQTMESLNEGVVQDEHDSGGIPGPPPVPEEHLTDITDVPNLWMSQTEFPDNE